MTTTFKPLPPPVGSGGVEFVWQYLRRIYDAIRGIQAGKINCTKPAIDADTTVTLRQSQTTTTLTDPRIGVESVILFMPITDHAAGAMTNLYVSARAQGSATLTHSSTADTDKSYGIVIIG